jgi:hypothetical protein
MYVVITLVAFEIKFLSHSFALDSKCAHYISKCICFVHKPSTKVHLGWLNDRSLILKIKFKHKIRLF